MIRYRNSQWGFWSNVIFGWAILLDAVVSISTLGFFMGSFQLSYARWRTQRVFQKQKSAAVARQKEVE